MGKLIDLTGRRFCRLKVIKKDRTDRHGNARWYCLCDCGQYTVVRSDDLRRGKTLSCGCLRVGGMHKTHGGTYTKLFRVWCSMRARCGNPNDRCFHRYGGRGIKVCEEWDTDFSSFKRWSEANGYEEGLTIDRIDNDKGYSPDNCRWTTMKVQNNNKSNNKKDNGPEGR